MSFNTVCSFELEVAFNKKNKMKIQKNIQDIIKSIPENVTLVAVSKTKPISDLQEAYNGGQRIFGENKIQEMAAKTTDIEKAASFNV